MSFAEYEMCHCESKSFIASRRFTTGIYRRSRPMTQS